jgi:hypothetical protein
MKTPGPSYRYLHFGLGLLAVILLLAGWILIWFYSEFFAFDAVTLGWMIATLILPAIQLIGGWHYARGKEWGRRMVDILALAVYLGSALLAGRLFFAATRLMSRTPPRTDVVSANPFLDLSFGAFFAGVFLVLVMLFEVLVRGVLWKPGVMLFFNAEAAREDLRARLLRRMGLIGVVLLVLSFGASWIWPNLPR